MRSGEPVRVEVQHHEDLRSLGIGFVVSSQHPEILVDALASVMPSRVADVLAPMYFMAGGQLYRADYAPMRTDEEETRRMYFIRCKVGWWQPNAAI